MVFQVFSGSRWVSSFFLLRFFLINFFGMQVHHNYLVEDRNHDLYVASVVLTDATYRNILQYRVILWTKHGSKKLSLSYQDNKQISVKQILRCVSDKSFFSIF